MLRTAVSRGRQLTKLVPVASRGFATEAPAGKKSVSAGLRGRVLLSGRITPCRSRTWEGRGGTKQQVVIMAISY